MNALAEFKDYYKRLDGMIAESSKADLAERARLLALNVAHYKAKYGGLPLEKHQAMFPFNDIDEDIAKRSTRQTLARCRRFAYRSQKAGIMRSVLLAMGIATVSVLTPPANAETKEVDITCAESAIQIQMEFKTMADDDPYCRKWIVRGRGGPYVEAELFHRVARFAGASIAIYYMKAGPDAYIEPYSVKESLESYFEAIGMSASNWGPTTKVKSGGKTFRTRKFVLRGDQTCVGFLATGAREGRYHADELTGFFCETGQEYRKEFIAAFLSQIKITRKSKSPDAYRIERGQVSQPSEVLEKTSKRIRSRPSRFRR